MDSRIKIDKMVGLLVMILLTAITFTDYFNYIQYNLIAYDEAYNATVAANYARYHLYKVSYPGDIIFYNMITTGETVLLPTAFLYKYFGIDNVTTSIVPIIYSMLSIWCIWFFLTKCLKQVGSIRYSVSAFAMVALIMSDGLYYYISTRLIGEIAALTFFLLSFIMLSLYLDEDKHWYLVISGFFAMWAFLTKSSMIFILISLLGLEIVETVITKSIKWRGLLCSLLGMVMGFVLLETFKFFQLGGWSAYIGWWRSELSNMMSQSGGVTIQYSLSEKINYLNEIFCGYNKYFCLVMVMLPVLAYAIAFFTRLKGGRLSGGILAMTIAGVCGSSLIVFFVLLGGSGLFNARRQEVNAILVRLYLLYLLCIPAVFIVNSQQGSNRKKIISLCCSATVFLFFFPIDTIKDNIVIYMGKNEENSYELDLMNEFLLEVENLPEEAVLYTAGWWQEPDITLFLDKKMQDVYGVMNNNANLPEEAYFISGNFITGVTIDELQRGLNAELVRFDTSEVDYSRITPIFDRNDVESYAIYKIEPHES